MANPYHATVPAHIIQASEDRFLRQAISAAHEKERIETEVALARRRRVPYERRDINAQLSRFRAQIAAAVARHVLTSEQAVVREEQYYWGMLFALGTGRKDKEDRKLLRYLRKEMMKGQDDAALIT